MPAHIDVGGLVGDVDETMLVMAGVRGIYRGAFATFNEIVKLGPVS